MVDEQTSKFITSDDFKVHICEALKLDPDKVRRIIVDVDAEEIGLVPVYVEMYADADVLAVDWNQAEGMFKVVRCLEKARGYE